MFLLTNHLNYKQLALNDETKDAKHTKVLYIVLIHLGGNSEQSSKPSFQVWAKNIENVNLFQVEFESESCLFDIEVMHAIASPSKMEI